jgi:hypothetical protein
VAGQESVPLYDQRGTPFGRVVDGDAANGARIDIGAVEVQFAAPSLPGDYNRDSSADAADYVFWRKTLGMTGVPAYDGADGDGDTTIDDDDHRVWVENFGETAVGSGEGGGGSAEAVGRAEGGGRIVGPGVASSLFSRDAERSAEAVRGQETSAQQGSGFRIADLGLRIEEGRESRVKSREPEQAAVMNQWRDVALAAWLASRDAREHEFEDDGAKYRGAGRDDVRESSLSAVDVVLEEMLIGLSDPTY